MEKFTMKAGKYYVGDPSYVFGGDDWMEVLHKSHWFQEPYVKGKKQAMAFGTGDDGSWFDKEGNEYFVDAAMLGIVPMSMSKIKKPVDEWDGKPVRLVHFKEDFEVYRDEKVLHFGHIEIDLEPDEDEDDYCSECGHSY